MASEINEAESGTGSSELKLVRVVWPEETSPALFANNMLVQRDETTVYVSFFQFNPPIIMADTDEERKRAIEAVDKIHALPVARIAFPVQKTEALIAALKQQVMPGERSRE